MQKHKEGNLSRHYESILQNSKLIHGRIAYTIQGGKN